MLEREETIQEQELDDDYSSNYSKSYNSNDGDESNKITLDPYRKGLGQRSSLKRKKSTHIETWNLQTPRSTSKKVDSKSNDQNKEGIVLVKGDSQISIWQRIRNFFCLEPEEEHDIEKK